MKTIIAPKKDLISIADLTSGDIFSLLKEAKTLKELRKSGQEGDRPLTGKTLAMIFQKPSTRTTASFAAGMVQLGGFPLILNAQDMQIKRGESIADTAKTLSRFVDAIMIRANRHEDVEDLARYASIPVINGLSDKEHPCQVLGDLLTVLEQKELSSIEDFRKIKLTYLGDGNNMTHSLMLAAAILGMEMTVSCPPRYEPEKEFTQKAQSLAKSSGAKILLQADPMAAVLNSDVIYTDVWASMGKDEERDHRKQIFMPYQINASLLAFAKPDVAVMHCLPAHRGEEITEEVIDGPRSVIFDQAENRLHIQKAILLRLMQG
jgi:ornithine carbamoyltransferase